MNGDNALLGPGSNYVIFGGLAHDLLRGSADISSSAWQSGQGTNDFGGATPEIADSIDDFSRAEGDKFDLAAVNASPLFAGSQRFTSTGTGAFSANAALQGGELRYETVENQTNIFGDINGDCIADFAIILAGNIALLPTDFLI